MYIIYRRYYFCFCVELNVLICEFIIFQNTWLDFIDKNYWRLHFCNEISHIPCMLEVFSFNLFFNWKHFSAHFCGHMPMINYKRVQINRKLIGLLSKTLLKHTYYMFIVTNQNSLWYPGSCILARHQSNAHSRTDMISCRHYQQDK